MLSIRMQRTGRKGHAMFRVVVQNSRVTPTSGKIVAQIGSYDPHSKTVTLDNDKAAFYLQHGAQPSDRAAILLLKQGIDMPKWVRVSAEKTRTVRNPSKLRRNQPVEEVSEAAADAPVDAPEAETGTTES